MKFELFTYIGSKRKDRERILANVPSWVKTVFDPMCGSSVLLWDLKDRGCTITAVDISPMAYFWSKAILGTRKFTDEELNDLLSAEPYSGWLTNAEVLRPTNKDARRYIDGMAKKANSYSGLKREVALGILSNAITKFQGSLGIFRREFEPYKRSTIRDIVTKACAEVNDLVSEKGSSNVMMKDAIKMEVPKVDLIYFDPPYDMKGADEVPYGPHYTIINSILMQKEWKLSAFSRKIIPELIAEYAKKSKILLISTADDPKINYRKVLGENKKFVRLKKFKRRTGGAAPKAKKIQTDYLWIATDYQSFSEVLSESKEGMYLPKPHAKMIWDGSKNLIVKAKRYPTKIGRLLYVIDKDFAYGIIRLGPPSLIDVKQFKKTQEHHKVTDMERKKWWRGKRYLFSYPFTLVNKFETPRKIRLPKGIQTFVKEVEFLSQLEMIEDIKSYKPESVPLDVLRDDWRIVMAWYSSKKQGKEVKHSFKIIIDLAKGIYEELKKRGIIFHPETYQRYSRELFKIVAKYGEGYEPTYLPVGPSLDHDKGRAIKYPEVLKFWRKPIILVEDFVQVVGGAPSHPKEGTSGDVDILFRKNEPSNDFEDIPIKFRLFRALPRELGDRIHFVYDKFHGPFTNHVPVYHLALIPVKRPILHEMGEEEVWNLITDLETLSNEELIRNHNKAHDFYKAGKFKKNAIIDVHALIWREMLRRSIDHDKISPGDELDKKGKFPIQEYPPIPKGMEEGYKASSKENAEIAEEMEGYMEEIIESLEEKAKPAFVKPASGYLKFEFADPKSLWENWKIKYAKDKPIIIDPKWDGFSFSLVKNQDNIQCVTEDRRRDRSKIIPQVVDDIKKLKATSCSISAESVWFKEGHALQREEAIAIIVGKNPMPQEDVRMYCYDIINYNGKDISQLPYEERLNFLNKVLPKDLKYIKNTPRTKVNKFETYMQVAKEYAEVEGSEGIMAKVHDFKFEKDGRTTQMAKWKKSYDIEVEVTKRISKIGTKGPYKGKPIPGQYLYIIQVRDSKGEPIPIGRTFSTGIKAEPGDILTVRTARIRGFFDPERKKVAKFSLMWPKVLGKRTDKKTPISYKEIMKIAWFPKQVQLAEDKITLKFLGTKGMIEEENPNHKHNSSLLISYRDHSILVDWGETHAKEDLKKIPFDVIFLTHGHPDHVKGLAQGCSKPVYATKQTIPFLQEYKIEEIRDMEEGKMIRYFDFEVTPYFAYHSIKAPMHVLAIDVGGRRIVYASDVISIRDRERALSGCDVLIGDGSAVSRPLIRRSKDNKKVVYGHAQMETLVKWCETFEIPMLIFTHFGKEFVEHEEESKKKIHHEMVDIRFANDNQTFILGKLEQEMSKKLSFVYQEHFRGKSVHGDFRFEMNDHLEGWTLDDMVEAEITEPVTTMEQARKELGQPKNWKIDWSTGETITEPGKKVPLKILTQAKAKQPKEWLTLEGLIAKGKVGATKEYPGVMIIRDKGWFECGVRKPYMYEYFVHGKHLKGIYIFRKLPTAGFKPRKERPKFKIPMVWFFWKRKDQVPYMLSKRAIKTNTLPPVGDSWLPKEIERQIPQEMQYWREGSRQERLERVEQAVDFWNGKEWKLEDLYYTDKIKFLGELDA